MQHVRHCICGHLRISKRIKLNKSLIGTGFPFREFAHIDAYLAIFRDLTEKTSGMRRAGAATLDLAYVAAGRLDGFWEFGLSPWDMAAGSLLITESGGLVGDLKVTAAICSQATSWPAIRSFSAS